MKAQILKIAGVKSEKEFYKKFPTEEAFMKKHGKELAKLKKAQVGDVIQYTDVEPVNNRKIIDGTELIKDAEKETLSGLDQFKERAYELGVDSLTTEEEKEDFKMKAQLEMLMKQQQDNKGGGGLGLGDIGGLFGGGSGSTPTGSVEVGDLEMLATVLEGKKGGKIKPHKMYDPKTKKSKKAMTNKEHLALKKKGWGHTPPKAQFGFDQIDFGSYADMNFGQKVGKFASEDLGKILNDPATKDIMMGISKIKGQKDALKDLKQMESVVDIQRKAALSKPEQIEREYVRPEDIQNTGEEFFPIYGVGTNVLARNGQTMNMFGNPGYTPLNNVNKVKTFQDGGGVPYDAIGNVLGNFAYGDKANRDAGSNMTIGNVSLCNFRGVAIYMVD